MRTTLLSGIAVLLCTSFTQADQSLHFPKEDPFISFTAPDGWKAETKGDSLFVVSPDGGDVILEVMTMEAGIDEDAEALKEAKGTVDEDFEKLELTPGDAVEARGLELLPFGGEGVDESGPAHITMVVIKHPKAEHPILFSIIASKDNAEKHEAACSAMLNSISAPGAAKAPSGETQTYAYPDKDKPDFSVDFPADWKMNPTEEGAYVESPDKLVAMNVIIVDKADVADAEETLKKKVGDRFKEITWNQGKDPEVNKDEALGLTATFHNAQASDGEGTEKYAVNLVSYVRKSGDKSLVLLCQHPLKALEVHAEALGGVIKSVKVR